MALHRKVERLMALRPDLAIISELAHPETVCGKAPAFCCHDARWVGRLPHKGLAVYAFNGLSLRDSPLYHQDYEHFLPVEVEGDFRFNMLAVWAFNHRTRTEWLKREPATRRALEHYRTFMAAGGLIAGDFNASIIWDKPGRADNFGRLLEDLYSLGYVRAYHTWNDNVNYFSHIS